MESDVRERIIQIETPRLQETDILGTDIIGGLIESPIFSAL